MLCVQTLSKDLFRLEGTIIQQDDNIGSVVRLLSDEEHVVKEGPWDLIMWEYYVYGLLQRYHHFPPIFERFQEEGGPTASLLLHRVVCLTDIFKVHDPSLTAAELGQLPSKTIARCAAGLLRALRKMHVSNILHRDIHPGNICLPACPNIEEVFLMHRAPDSMYPDDDNYDFKITFIDYQWSTVNGFHPHMVGGPSIGMWQYASDRTLRGEEIYTRLDDLESLGYTFIALRLLRHPPWYPLIRDVAAKHPSFGYQDGDRDFIIKTRNDCLDAMRDWADMVPGLMDMLDFVTYVKSLQPGDEIQYNRWLQVFTSADRGSRSL